MTKVGRNDPCTCRSGLKAKRCCLAEDGAKVTTPKAALARLQPVVAKALAGFDKEQFRELYEEMLFLPELDVSLHLRLPLIPTPELEDAMSALTNEDQDDFDDAVYTAAHTLDTFEHRLELAEAVLTLRDKGLVRPEIAAVAIFDLNYEGSALLLSSLAQAIAVRNGSEATPVGLVLAS